MSLLALSGLGPLLLVCLPAPARRWLDAVARARGEVEAAGARLALVYHDASTEDEIAAAGLQYLARSHDPGRAVYRALELGEGGGGPLARLRRARAQLPGAFLVARGEVRAAFRPASARAAPDLVALTREGLRARA
jgi:hypothetical protein